MSNTVVGGMNVRAQPVDRLAQLEREVQRLRAQLDGLRAEPRLGRSYDARLARTRSDGTYPTPTSGANAFEFVYLDMDFTETEGDNPATLTELSAASMAVGKTSDDAYVPEETTCLAVTLPNRKKLLLPLVRHGSFKIGIAEEGIARRSQGGFVLDHGQVQIWTVNATHELEDTGQTVEAYNATSSQVFPGAMLLVFDDGSDRPLVVDHLSSARLAACSGFGGQEGIGSLPFTIPLDQMFGGPYSSSSGNECYITSNAINFPANRGIYLIDWSVQGKYITAPDQNDHAHYEGFRVVPHFNGNPLSAGRWCIFLIPPLTGGGATSASNNDKVYQSVGSQFAVLVNGAAQTVQFKITESALALNALSDFSVTLTVNCHAAGPGELAMLEDFSVPWRE